MLLPNKGRTDLPGLVWFGMSTVWHKPTYRRLEAAKADFHQIRRKEKSMASCCQSDC